MKKFEEQFENGVLRALLPLNEKGEYEGVAKWFREDGSLSARAVCRGGKMSIKNEYCKDKTLHTSHKFFDGAGTKSIFSIFKNGKLNEKISFSDSTGQNRVVEKYCENGKKSSKTLYKGDFPIKNHTYEEGSLKNTMSYSNGIRQRQLSFANKKMWFEIKYYPNGRPSYSCIYWDNGNKSKEEEYDLDSSTKAVRNFDEEGNELVGE